MPEETPAAPAGQPTPDPAPEAPKPQEPKTEQKTPEAGDPPKGDDEPLGEGGLRALQAEREAKKELQKALADREAKLKEYEDAKLTEQQRLEKERDEARETAATTAREAALYKAAIEHGLSAEDLELLEGVPADQIDDRAKRLSDRLKARPGTPKPDPSQGGRNGAGVDIDARIQEAQKRGDFRTVISLQNQKLAEQTK